MAKELMMTLKISGATRLARVLQNPAAGLVKLQPADRRRVGQALIREYVKVQPVDPKKFKAVTKSLLDG